MKKDTTELTDIREFVECFPMSPRLRHAFLGKWTDGIPFPYVENITREKFLSIPNVYLKTWNEYEHIIWDKNWRIKFMEWKNSCAV